MTGFLRFHAMSLLLPLLVLGGCPDTPSESSSRTSPSFLDELSPPPDTNPLDTDPEAAQRRSAIADLIATAMTDLGVVVSSSNATVNPGETRLSNGRTVQELVDSWNLAAYNPAAAATFQPTAVPTNQAVPDASLECHSGTAQRTDRETISGEKQALGARSFETQACYDHETGNLGRFHVPATFATPDVHLVFDFVGQIITISGADTSSAYRITATLNRLRFLDGADEAVIHLDLELDSPPLFVRVNGPLSIRAIRDDATVEYYSETRVSGVCWIEGGPTTPLSTVITVSGALAAE